MREKIFLTICLIASIAHSVRADHEDSIYPYKMETVDKKYLFVMLKSGSVSNPSQPIQLENYPQSGLYLNDGSSTPLWTVDWCANVLLPADGIHVVRKGRHTVPIEYNEEVITFFAYGKEVKSYRVNDLVQFPRLLLHSSNYYEWQKPISVADGATPFTIHVLGLGDFPYEAGVVFDEVARTMKLETSQGDVYLFDLTTGEIISSRRPVRMIFYTLLMLALMCYAIYLFGRTSAPRKPFRKALCKLLLGASILALLLTIAGNIIEHILGNSGSDIQKIHFSLNFFWRLLFFLPNQFIRDHIGFVSVRWIPDRLWIFFFWLILTLTVALCNGALICVLRLLRLRYTNMKLFLATFSLVCIFALGLNSSFAQQGAHDHQGAVDSIPADLFSRPLPLRDGTGKVEDPATTSSKEAQAFYNQGIAYLHSYVWIEAARSFHQALRLDARFSMAYAGLYRAYVGLNLLTPAREALAKAQSLAANSSNASPRERRRIALHGKQLEALADVFNAEKQTAYQKALDDALIADPQDVELILLRGNAEEGNPAAGRGQRGMESALAIYQRALSLAPNHIGAHHYLTHTYENLGRIPEALQHGEMCARLAPAVPHELHMYGHNLRRAGRIKEAIAQFEKADMVQRAYFKSENIPAEYDWHHQHNLDLLSTSYQYQGQMKKAEAIMREAFHLPSLMEAEAYNRKEWPLFLLSRKRADEALEAAAILKKSKWEIVRAIGLIMASHALMSQNKLPEASSEAKAALNELQMAGKKAAFVSADLSVLQGEFFLRTGQGEKGRLILKQAMTRMRAERGPDNWTQALFQLEAIARTARELNDWELAEYATLQLKEHDSNYAGTHLALAWLAEHKGDNAGMIAELKMAEKLWSEADADLPELAEVKARLTKLQSKA